MANQSVILEFNSQTPPYKVFGVEAGYFPYRLQVNGEESEQVGFSANGDILTTVDNQFVGMAFPLYDEEERSSAHRLIEQEGGRYLHYVEAHSSYARAVYIQEELTGLELLEVRLFNEIPARVVHALSTDGGWYFNKARTRLLGFIFADVNRMLEESDVSIDRLALIPERREK